MAVHPTLDVLRRADAFLSGFEGDSLQEGIDALLVDVRAAVTRIKSACAIESWQPFGGGIVGPADILVCHAEHGWWTRATIFADGTMLMHGGKWTPTHWRAAPVLPTVAAVEDEPDPPCTNSAGHEWVTADRDEGGDGRCYCIWCGADGDA